MTETPPHLPLGIRSTDVGPFIKCSCGTNPSPHHWLDVHWPGDKAEGTRLAEEMFAREQAKMAEGAVVEQPTFTASEVKELTTKATEVALALGRKEAATEVAEAIRRSLAAHYSPGHDEVMIPHETAIGLALEIASRVPERGSEPLTAPTGNSDLPPTPEAPQKGI